MASRTLMAIHKSEPRHCDAETGEPIQVVTIYHFDRGDSGATFLRRSIYHNRKFVTDGDMSRGMPWDTLETLLAGWSGETSFVEARKTRRCQRAWFLKHKAQQIRDALHRALRSREEIIKQGEDEFISKLRRLRKQSSKDKARDALRAVYVPRIEAIDNAIKRLRDRLEVLTEGKKTEDK